MRFMTMHKMDAQSEAGVPPPPEMFAAMGELMSEAGSAGVLLGGEGLPSSTKRVRVRFEGGRRTVTKGPFKGSNELVSGFAMIKTKSMEEAVEWGSRLAAVLGRSEIEIGPVCEPWDLGFGEKPPGDLPIRFLVLTKADARSESGASPTEKEAADVRKLIGDMTKAGVFLSAEGLQPSVKGARLRCSADGSHTVKDGPFAESKELIGGYAMLNLPSLEACIEWCTRFARVLTSTGAVGDVEIDILPVREADSASH